MAGQAGGFMALDPRWRWAILFLPTAFVLWYLLLVKPAGWPQWLNMVSIAQLALGEFARRRLFGDVMAVTGRTGWPWALVALAVLQVGQWSFANHMLGDLDPILEPLMRLVHLVILVGYVEELWFRGLWHHAARRLTLGHVLIGALIFALYHWPQGYRTVIFTFSVGLVYGAARVRGAPILALGLAHGIMNWLNMTGVPAIGLRFDQPAMLIGFPLICLLASALMLRGAPALAAATETTTSPSVIRADDPAGAPSVSLPKQGDNDEQRGTDPG